MATQERRETLSFRSLEDVASCGLFQKVEARKGLDLGDWPFIGR